MMPPRARPTSLSDVREGFLILISNQCLPGPLDFRKKTSTVKLHKRGPLLQTAGHPLPLLLGQPSSALLSTAQAGGPPSVKIGWATKTIIFEDVRGHKMTSFFTCKFLGNLQFWEFFSAPHVYYRKLSEI